MSHSAFARTLPPALALLLAGSCYIEVDSQGDGPDVQGSGVVVSELRAPGDFHSIDASGGYRLEVQVGAPSEVVVVCDDNLLECIETSVDDGVLRVRSHCHFSTRSGVTLRLRTPELRALDFSGSADLQVSGLSGERFELDLAGSSSGSFSGSIDELRVDVSGSCDLDLGALVARRAHVALSGSSALVLHVEDELTGDVAGSSSIRYRGHPAIEFDQSGAASLTRIE